VPAGACVEKFFLKNCLPVTDMLQKVSGFIICSDVANVIKKGIWFGSIQKSEGSRQNVNKEGIRN